MGGCCGASHKPSAAAAGLFNDTGEYASTDVEKKFKVVRVAKMDDRRFPDAVDVLARSWCGTGDAAPEPLFDWTYEGKFAEASPVNPIPLASGAPSVARAAWFAWLLKFIVFYGLSRNAVYVLVDENDTVVAACVAPVCGRPSSATSIHRLGTCEYLRLGAKVGDPPKNDSDGKDVMRRMDAGDKVLAGMHGCAIGKKQPHVHLLAIGTDPKLQGRGCGKTLLRFVCALADAEGVDCYLETAGKHHEDFYAAKGGFEVVERKTVEACKGKFVFDMGGGMAGMIRRFPTGAKPVGGPSEAWQ